MDTDDPGYSSGVGDSTPDIVIPVEAVASAEAVDREVVEAEVVTPPTEAETTSLVKYPVEPTQTIQMAESVLPSFDWDNEKKRLYLSYRMCAFGKAEACVMAGIAQSTVTAWRKSDSEFNKLENTNLMDLRKQYSKEVLLMEFTRNLRMVVDADHQVLSKLVNVGINNMTREERGYIEKMRASYGPAQLNVLEQLFKESGDGDWDWEAIVHGKGEMPRAK